MKKRTLSRRVQLHPGANAGKAFISTALEPDWKFIFFLNKRSGCGEHIVHIDGVVGSSPTVTTTNPVGVQVQRLPDFFAYPSRVRTFRSQEYALFCQRGTQKGYAVHLKTAYPWKHFVHIHRDALANFRFFHQKHKQLTSSFSFEFRMPNRKKFQKIINTHLVAVL